MCYWPKDKNIFYGFMKHNAMNQCFSILFFVLILDHGICEQEILNNNIKTKYTDSLKIPIVVYFDKALPVTLLTHKSKNPDSLKTIAKNILEDVEDIYRHPSLNVTVKFDLIDVRILKNNTKRKIMDANASRYLKGFCRWQGEKKLMRQQMYHSLLISGLDLFYVNKDRQPVMSSKGRGYYRGLCSKNHSCTILEWYPDSMGFLFAHEIAHSLGINHNGAPHNECKEKWFIMDAQYNPRDPVKSWTQCNKRDLKQFLQSKYAWCL